MEEKTKKIIDVNEDDLIRKIYEMPKQGFESKQIHKLHKSLDDIEGYENKKLILPMCFDITRAYDDMDAKKDTYLLNMWSVFTDKFVNGTPIKDTAYNDGRKTHHYTVWQEKLLDLKNLESRTINKNLIVGETYLNTMQEMKGKYVETGIQDLVTQYTNLHKIVASKEFESFKQKLQDNYALKKMAGHYEEIKKNVDKALIIK